MRPFADIRKARGLDARWAAIALGISRGYLLRLERGATPLAWCLAEKMALLYGCDLTALTFGEAGRDVVR